MEEGQGDKRKKTHIQTTKKREKKRNKDKREENKDVGINTIKINLNNRSQKSEETGFEDY